MFVRLGRHVRVEPFLVSNLCLFVLAAMDMLCKTPATIPFDLVIRLPIVDFDPMKHMGGLHPKL